MGLGGAGIGFGASPVLGGSCPVSACPLFSCCGLEGEESLSSWNPRSAVLDRTGLPLLALSSIVAPASVSSEPSI